MLAEATQSQQVRRETEKTQSVFSKKEQDKSNNKKMKTALILFEDIDLVFGDLDDGFYGAVNTLSQQSKRPIIMTLSSCHWLRVHEEKLFKFTPLVFTLKPVCEKELVNSLQVLALVEGYLVGKVDLLELVRMCKGVRQCVLQLQVLCESGLVRGGGREEESVGEGGENKEESVDVRKWFRHIDSKARRKGVVPDSCGLGNTLHGVGHSNVDWWENLTGVSKEMKEAVKRYPLKESDAGKGSYSRIDPLKNKELFDAEDSESEMEVESNEETDKSVKQQRDLKTSNSKSKVALNLQSLSRISRHLDLASEFSSQLSDTPWHILPPVSDSTAQAFPDFRETKDEVGNIASFQVQVINMSEELVSRSFHNMEEKILTMENMKKYKEETDACQSELFYSGLVETYMLDRVGRTELISGMRGLARGEEHRKMVSNNTSRRGNRFTHFFAQNDVFLGQETLYKLCNSLVD